MLLVSARISTRPIKLVRIEVLLESNTFASHFSASASNEADQQSNEILHRLKLLAEKTQALIDVRK